MKAPLRRSSPMKEPGTGSRAPTPTTRRRGALQSIEPWPSSRSAYSQKQRGAMQHNAKLLEQLYNSLGRHDYQAMANCYHPDARFRDIAFDLKGRDQIRAMW